MYGKDSFKITASLQPATGPYSQPDEPTTQPQTILFLMYLIIVHLSSFVFQAVPFLKNFPSKTFYAFLFCVMRSARNTYLVLDLNNINNIS